GSDGRTFWSRGPRVCPDLSESFVDPVRKRFPSTFNFSFNPAQFNKCAKNHPKAAWLAYLWGKRRMHMESRLSILTSAERLWAERTIPNCCTIQTGGTCEIHLP